jgi:hypothetical protein
LNETILWLLYVVGAVAAYAAVQKLGWRIVPSTILGCVPTLLGWAVLYFLTARDDRPAFWRVDLSLNLSFALIFAACGAAAGFAMQYRSSRGEDGLTNGD